MSKRWYNENPTHTIYALVDPETFEPRYVGVTRQLEARYKQHLAGDGSPEKKYWIQLLRQRGLEPELFILERVQKDYATVREWVWINHYTRMGYGLFNQ